MDLCELLSPIPDHPSGEEVIAIYSDIQYRASNECSINRRYLVVRGCKIFYLEENRLHLTTLPQAPPFFTFIDDDFLLSELRAVGYNPQSLRIDSFLEPLIGSTWEEVLETARKRGEQNKKSKTGKAQIRKESNRKQKELNARFDGMILGIDKNFFRSFPTGFAVRVMMRATISPVEKREFITANKQPLLLWVMEEIGNSRKIMNQIGDVSFYTPTEIIFLQTSEIEIICENKDVAGSNQAPHRKEGQT